MRLVLVKCLALLTLGCIPIAVEQHGGLSPRPSKVSDAGFAAIGATFDQGLILARVPVVPRIAVDALAAWSIRNVSTFGRSVDSGFMFVIGVYPPEFVRFLTHAGRWNREHGR